MGTIFSSIKDCLNKMFSKEDNKNINKNEFNIIPQSEEKNIKNTKNLNDKSIPLLTLSEDEDNRQIESNKNLSSSKGYNEKIKDA